MNSETKTQELLELVRETKKHLKYLQELGVEGIQRSVKEVGPVRKEYGSRPSVTPASHRSELFNAAQPSGDRLANSSLPSSLFGDLGLQPERLAPSTETFEEIWSEVGDCTRCPLHQGRTNVVHTEGNRKARLMFVGEAPGADEDAQARPFVGRAGQLLTKIIEAIGLKREEVLIGNVNRCRPPSNRTPT